MPSKSPPIESFEQSSADLVLENIDSLKELFPEIVKDGNVDFDALRQLLGDEIDDSDEKFGLTWHGKRRARQFALTPSTGTLRPAPEESVDWDTTEHVMIEGDNLEVLKLLQKSYAGRVKLIYVDPPYNTGKDFVYKDDYRDSIGNYLEITGQSENGRKVSTNTEASGRFHTDWLNMIYPRLRLARQLLRQNGVMLISVDDTEVNRLKDVVEEIYGEENFLSVLIWNKQHSQQQGLFKRYHEYVLAVARSEQDVEGIKGGQGEIDAGALKRISRSNPESEFRFPAGVRFDAPDGFELAGTFGGSEKVTVKDGRFLAKDRKTAVPVTLSAGWTQKNQMTSYFEGNETYDTKGQRVLEFYFSGTGKLKCRKEREAVTPPSLLPKYGMVSEQTAYLAELMDGEVFSNPKPVAMMKDFIEWFAVDGDIVMDFFAGSGTIGEGVFRRSQETGHRLRFVLVQLPENLDIDDPDQKVAATYCDNIGRPRNIAELTKERLRRAAAKIREEHPDYEGDIGFRVFKLDSSNLRAWDPQPEDLEETLLETVSHLKEDRSEQDVLYELLLKLGLDLCVPIETKTIADKSVHSIGAGTLFACLDETLEADTAEDLALGIIEWRNQLDPAGDTTVVFRDSAFPDDVTKTNLDAILKQHNITTVRSI